MSEIDENNTQEKDKKLQIIQKKYEQMALDHEQAEERTTANFEHEANTEEDVNTLPIPTKIILVCFALFLGGSILFSIGLIGILGDETQTGRDISLLTLGSILLIPGLFYSYQLISACFARTRSERQQILNEFPLDYYE